MSAKRAIVFGGTGQVGRWLVRELASPETGSAFSEVTLVQRREFDYGLTAAAATRVRTVIIEDMGADLSSYSESLKGHNAIFITLATSRAQAKSSANFVRIDQDIPVQLATACLDKSVPGQRLVYCSAANANEKSWLLYPRSKGQTEARLRAAMREHGPADGVACMVQPALIEFPESRDEPRIAERIIQHALIPIFRTLNVKYWSTAPQIAHAMRLVGDGTITDTVIPYSRIPTL